MVAVSIASVLRQRQQQHGNGWQQGKSSVLELRLLLVFSRLWHGQDTLLLIVKGAAAGVATVGGTELLIMQGAERRNSGTNGQEDTQ